ncbi:hypothetical protein Taro_014851 [Colocasia esculenta]|uniref:PH domain-containing protein n=1 Tax=Colocasia esculenta TaxID=4460 RepID=A0A843UKK8_COLES|nr:hypothetical protein [Colocasia esculenta]
MEVMVKQAVALESSCPLLPRSRSAPLRRLQIHNMPGGRRRSIRSRGGEGCNSGKMLEDQVASLLQRYLGNYVRGLNKEALNISVWRGDVELTNMQLKPEALNALKLPVKVKAGFLGSIRLKVPWSRLGQEPVLVYLDRILILAEPETQVEGFSEETIQEAKRSRVREMEMRLLEAQQHLKSEINTSWLGSLINTIIGNLKLSITNIHIRYEDLESNPGHPFAAGLTLGRLSAMTVDDAGKEAFATGGALEHIQKIFEIEKHRSSSASVLKEHCYILQPVTGNARYTKIRLEECRNVGQPLQKASINLEDVTLCLSQDGYKDILRLADNFAAFNQRLKYAHYRPQVPIKADSRSWWKYAYKVVTDEMKAASGMLSWEQVLRHARLRKKYISLYASLLKSDASQMVADDNEEIKKLDRELDIDVILQWRMLAHKFVQQSMESDDYQNKQRTRLVQVRKGKSSKVHMKHNASKLISRDREHLADLSCDGLDCAVKIYSESKVFDLKLGSYRLSSPSGLLAESATIADSLVGIFSYKPFESELDWSFVAKASPCYMTYLKDSIDHIISFFRSSSAISQTLALETAAAVQMTLDGVKRTAQKQVSRALKDHARFLLDLDIAAPKITIPTEFCPDNVHATKLLLDLGNLKLSTQDKNDLYSDGKRDLNLQFNVVLNDVSAFLVDGEYSWRIPHTHMPSSSGKLNYNSLLPVIDKCAIVLKLQQIQSENPFYQSTEVAVRLPAFGFHFSPARYHRLMKVLKLFQDDQSDTTDFICPWNQADFEGWLSVLSWKGVGNREAVWQHRYVCIVGAFLYILKNPSSKTYKQYFSLRGKQVHHLPLEFTGDQEHVLAVCDSSQLNNKVVEDVNALILRCDTDESRRTWQNRLQGAIYRASGPAAVSGLSDVSSTLGTTKAKQVDSGNIASISSMEKLFVTGVLDELKICFSCNYHSNQNFNMLLLGKESGLFELRASGGQVELSVRQNDLFIGTILKSLEVEDLFCFKGMTKPRYLARSFIKSKNDTALNSSLFFSDGGDHKFSSSDQSQLDGEESFFEASDKLSDFVEPAFQPQEDACTDSSDMVSFPSSSSSISAPSFNRVPGLLPDSKSKNSMDLEKSKTLDSFVKAQIIIFDQDSPLYNSNLFVNAINAEDDDKEMFLDTASADEANSSGDVLDQSKSGLSQEPVIKGLLGRGKSRVLFCLSLNMATAQIFLMNENGTCLTTLSQNNLRTEIKVFPSSFNVKASLGNLKINDDSLPLEHPYFWVCDMRNPVGSSFVELEFSSFSVDDEDYEGFEYSLNGQLSEVRIIYLNRFVQEVVSYFMGLAPSNSKGLVKLKDQVTDSEKWFTSSEIEGSPAVKLDLSLTKPIILMPRRTNSLDYLELDVLEIAVYNTFQWFGGDKNEINAVHIEMMTVKVPFRPSLFSYELLS